ncbi:MAG: hypothetical protein Q9191_006806 [Dirinaria sp. TL-2023a]
MNLRKSIKRRTFYDDRDYHDPNQHEVYRASPKAVKPAYKGKIVEFNPNLRPAAFPTISLGQVVVEEVEEEKEEEDEPTIKEASAPDSSESSTPNPHPQTPTTLATSNNQVQSVDALCEQPHSGNSIFDVSNMYTSIDKAVWSQRLTMSPTRTPSPPCEMSSNGSENPVFVNNMKLLEKLSKRTDEAWAAAEMETSDEDEDDGPRERHKADLSNPQWEHLPLALQLDIIDTVGEGHENLEVTFKALRLRLRQRVSMREQLRIRNQYLDAEETVIDSLHRMVENSLLTGSKKEVDHLVNGGYQRQMKRQLFIVDGKIDYLTSTGRDVTLAKVYLKTCGIKPEILDHWTSFLNDGDDKETHSGSTEAHISPTPAPPSTLPLDINADAKALPRPTLPPVNIYQKPRPPTTVTRRQSRPPHAKDALAIPGTQGKAIPMEKGGPAYALKSPKEVQLDSVQPDADTSGPPSKEPYQIPPLAAPFSLPPQLSTQRQAWLPDAPPANQKLKGPNAKSDASIEEVMAHPRSIIRDSSVGQNPTKDPSATVHGHRGPLAHKNVLQPNNADVLRNVGSRDDSHDQNTCFPSSRGEKDLHKDTDAHQQPQHKMAAEGQSTPRPAPGESRSIGEGRHPVVLVGEMSQDFPKRSGSMVPIKRPGTSNVAYGVARGSNPAGFQYQGQPSPARSRNPTAPPSGSNTPQLQSSMAGSPTFDAGYQAKEQTNVLGKRLAHEENSKGGESLAKSRKVMAKGGSRH